ncbi:MAG: hypothetical protein A3C93_00895 [Candidatus Lloydbacteria bacterium RIFCSPHIGHO2_02_FULL_54_17]|uniref:Uncharacterized protein n=1 Tax=Candidatus Lloydbacteria bacterium RIFCSPHIGHO2_02_FULL_54_17 TaxID=1798664 RepID=A0A1G2DD26_9BACT|nr:MAG: hypothetical protein A2762_01470 [Candidatus Lloydbacteria bacterium RIFCSPHIGHO2_01_FULL_54_11]OGZ11544.1 MAG: hypothetical protein A3C93_00895 [Candidatus Lloydbacteria bacterium RIFCSPHIGHO2_02_FULL_54_17]OGZ14827.1 MAG: hypothetical protein A3H76_05090 [Candidatus Lloydbacteria bacterium RIFCSPLOWO2_02_FULL_54_12]
MILASLFLVLATIPCSKAVAGFPESMYLRQSPLGTTVGIVPSGEENSRVSVQHRTRTTGVIITGKVGEREVKEFIGGQATLVMVRDPADRHSPQKIYLCFGKDADCAEVVDLIE